MEDLIHTVSRGHHQHLIPDHCTPTTQFLARLSAYTGYCIPTHLAALSTFLGCMSLVSWLFAQLPQIYTNYKIQSTAGLSFFFLAEWLLGDVTNLTGALLTHQAGWQVVVASYYVFVDVCLTLQWFWYSHLKTKFADGSVHSRDTTLNAADDDDAGSDLIRSLSPIDTSFNSNRDADPKSQPVVVFKTPPRAQPMNTPRFSPVNYEKESTSPETYRTSRSNSEDSAESGESSESHRASWSVPASPRTIVFAASMTQLMSQAVAAPVRAGDGSFVVAMAGGAQHQTTAEYVGMIISWCSTFLYLGSRLPQIYKNWRRRSTAGLSPLLFFAAFCGNFFYTTSLLSNPRAWRDFGPYGGHGWVGPAGSERRPWIVNTAPFFLGAFGCLGLDMAIGVQFLMYGDGMAKLVKVRDPRGFSRWEKVSGFLRGWIPVLAREKVVDLAESQRLLNESREIERWATHTSSNNNSSSSSNNDNNDYGTM